jgi:hypothetical protein
MILVQLLHLISLALMHNPVTVAHVGVVFQRQQIPRNPALTVIQYGVLLSSVVRVKAAQCAGDGSPPRFADIAARIRAGRPFDSAGVRE